MDTRNKIVSLSQAQSHLARGNWLVVAGYFDPVTAAVARRIGDVADPDRRDKVLAVVLNGSDTLLSAEARCILVAALRDVHAVVAMPSEEGLETFVPQTERVRVVFDREADRTNSLDFAALVLGKEEMHLQTGELES